MSNQKVYKAKLMITGGISIIIDEIKFYVTIPMEFSIKVASPEEEFLEIGCQAETIADYTHRVLKRKLKTIIKKFNLEGPSKLIMEIGLLFTVIVISSKGKKYSIHFPFEKYKIALVNIPTQIANIIEDSIITEICQSCILQCQTIKEIVEEITEPWS